jgi:hypothetical protein
MMTARHLLCLALEHVEILIEQMQADHKEPIREIRIRNYIKDAIKAIDDLSNASA